MSKKNDIITSKMLAHIAVSPALGSQVLPGFSLTSWQVCRLFGLLFCCCSHAHRNPPSLGFLIFSHARVRPLSYRERMRFTMPSSPKPQSLAAREARPGVSIQN